MRRVLSVGARVVPVLAIVGPPAWVVTARLVFGDWPAWSGIGEVPNPDGVQPAKTLWDVWGLLIIPLVLIVLAVEAYWFNKKERETDRQIANARVEKDNQLAKDRVEQDRELATDRQREDALQAYLDKMTELMIEHGMHRWEDDGPPDELKDKYEAARYVARARTLTMLRSLDSERTTAMMRFLMESGLANSDSDKEPVVALIGASLRRANLQGAELQRANLERANLFKADLQEANLRRASLQGANLEKANLILASLQGANLQGARLQGATMPSGTKHV